MCIRDRRQGRWDTLILELHRLRDAAGVPTYAALTRDLIAQRMAEGQDEHAARIARSSVHDAFRFGRSRINARLVKELVQVMGGDPASVDGWIASCTNPTLASAPPPVAVPPVEQGEPEPARAPVVTVRQQLALAAGCLVLNLLGRHFVDFFELPIYLDMVGTAVAAIVLGPWRGAAVGGLTNLLGAAGSGWVSLPFALVNIFGALVWGYGVRRFDMGRSLPRFFCLNVITAVCCSLLAIPIIALVLDGGLRNGHDVITELINQSISTFHVALGISNLLTSLGDKLVSGFVALVIISVLPLALRARARLVFVDGAHQQFESSGSSTPR